MLVKSETNIPTEMICGLLCTAFEGGVNYWAQIQDIKPGTFPAELCEKEWKEFRHTWAPLSEGGSIQILDMEEGDTHTLNLESIQKGLALFLATRHGIDFLTGKDDATTGDVFIQYCLFGEEIYG